MRKAALYIRVSTVYQVDKYSIPMQKEDLISFCKLIHIDEYEVFIDAGYSGKDTDRPAFRQMMQRIRNGEFSHVLVWKIDRISRNLIDFAKMYEELKKYDVTFVSRNEQFDTSTAMGEAMLKIILVFAELERKMTSERVLATMIDRAKNGLWNGARMPLGYKWSEEKKFPVPDEEESKIIHMIFDIYEEMHSTTYVMRQLNRMGIKTKRGGAWTTKTISDIIRNKLYKGVYVYNARESARGKYKPEEEWIIVNTPHTMIITPEQWDRCNEIMDNNSQKYGKQLAGKRCVKYQNIFAGLIVCGKCGKSYIASGKEDPNAYGFRPTRYICTTRSKESVKGCDNVSTSDILVGNFIFNLINKILTLDPSCVTRRQVEKHITYYKCKSLHKIKKINSDGLDSLISMQNATGRNLYSQANKKLLQAKSDVDQLNKDKARYETAIDRLEDMYLFDDMPKQKYMEKKKQIVDKLNAVNEELLNISQETGKDVTFINDLNMMNDISTFFLKRNLIGSDRIDFKKLSGVCEDRILKKFVNAVVAKIVMIDRHIVEVEFKNGLDLRFEY